MVITHLVRIFSKFREISQICEYRERKNLQVNTIRVFTWVFTRVNAKVNTELGGKTGNYPGYLPLGIYLKVFTITLSKFYHDRPPLTWQRNLRQTGNNS